MVFPEPSWYPISPPTSSLPSIDALEYASSIFDFPFNRPTRPPTRFPPTVIFSELVTHEFSMLESVRFPINPPTSLFPISSYPIVCP